MSNDDESAPLRERFPQYEIGEHSYGGLTVVVWDEVTKLKIGKFCSFAFDVHAFLGGEHRSDWVTTFPFPVEWSDSPRIEGHPGTRGDVVIGNDVWVGAGALLLSGTSIGDGACVAARSVVAGRVAPYSIVGGNPARFLRWRFSQPLIGQLIAMRWWDWPRERIMKALPKMLSTDVSAFVQAVNQGDL